MNKKIRFNNGEECPILGFGTARLDGDQCYEIVKSAIDAGYRHFDCAHLYRNEPEIGRAFFDKINDGTVEREDLFVAGKLWNSFHRIDMAMLALERSLEDLGLDYLDLYLIHWPMAFKDGWEMNLKDANGRVPYSDADFTDTWRVLETAVEKGLVRSIGVSNFNRAQIEDILRIARIKPVVNQVECHPYLNQSKLLDYCRSQDIALSGYRVIGLRGGPTKSAYHDLLIAGIAAKHDKTPAQVLIRYQVQRGVIAITKTTSRKNMLSNLNVFDFELGPDDVESINKLDRGRAGRNYPFHSDC
ncbi:unnamed protein product [Nesidiocoris tenuis]|uniref:NADP-dependent oxidoreductase domain-containing protein n=1 Tax=Nesidiocoris tenuis TaxID=355587 RepID=A0A6H5GC67_9HEMI|nr:unnamed protein product [Nesidiocoris tenuis]